MTDKFSATLAFRWERTFQRRATIKFFVPLNSNQHQHPFRSETNPNLDLNVVAFLPNKTRRSPETDDLDSFRKGKQIALRNGTGRSPTAKPPPQNSYQPLLTCISPPPECSCPFPPSSKKNSAGTPWRSSQNLPAWRWLRHSKNRAPPLLARCWRGKKDQDLQLRVPEVHADLLAVATAPQEPERTNLLCSETSNHD